MILLGEKKYYISILAFESSDFHGTADFADYRPIHNFAVKIIETKLVQLPMTNNLYEPVGFNMGKDDKNNIYFIHKKRSLF